MDILNAAHSRLEFDLQIAIYLLGVSVAPLIIVTSIRDKLTDHGLMRAACLAVLVGSTLNGAFFTYGVISAIGQIDFADKAILMQLYQAHAADLSPVAQETLARFGPDYAQSAQVLDGIMKERLFVRFLALDDSVMYVFAGSILVSYALLLAILSSLMLMRRRT